MKRSFFGRPLLSMSAAFVALAIAWPAGAQSQQPIYGSQLMTQQERLEYQQRIRSAKSEAERQRIRSEHHAQMQERARGVTLPGMGPGQGRRRKIASRAYRVLAALALRTLFYDNKYHNPSP